MNFYRSWKYLVIGGILIALLSGCGTAAPETPTPEPTNTQIPPTNTAEPTHCDMVQGVCLELTFDGNSCLYKGPISIESGPIAFIYRNESEVLAATNLVKITEGKTLQDHIDYIGEEPSEALKPDWAVEIPGVFEEIEPDESHFWEGVLDSGIYDSVCFIFEPWGVWRGSELTVEDK